MFISPLSEFIALHCTIYFGSIWIFCTIMIVAGDISLLYTDRNDAVKGIN